MNMAFPPSRSAPPLGAASPPGVTSTPTEQARHHLWSTSQTDERRGQGSGQGVSSSVRAMSTTANALSPTYADAALIAAAPELLAACKAAQQFMELIGNPAPPHPWMQIRDAVAKAETKVV